MRNNRLIRTIAYVLVMSCFLGMVTGCSKEGNTKIILTTGFEKDYVVDEGNPYAYINEFRNVVNKIHEAGLRVVLDVVDEDGEDEVEETEEYEYEEINVEATEEDIYGEEIETEEE